MITTLLLIIIILLLYICHGIKVSCHNQRELYFELVNNKEVRNG